MTSQYKPLKYACAVVGLLVAVALNIYYLGFDPRDPETGVFFIKLIVLPVLAAFVLSLLLTDAATSRRWPSIAFNWVTAGVELGLFVLGWHVLLDWYRNPDLGRYEPLFVAITVAAAVIEYCRATLRRSRQKQGTFEKIVKHDDDDEEEVRP